MYCICFIWSLLDLKPEAWQQLMYSSPEREGTFFYTSKRLELWSWEDYKLYQLLLPRVVDFSSPLQCTVTRILCFKPEKVQKRKGLRWILAKNAMSLKRTDSFCTVSWGSKAYIITFCECVSLLVLPLLGQHQSNLIQRERSQRYHFLESLMETGICNLSSLPIKQLEIYTRKRYYKSL